MNRLTELQLFVSLVPIAWAQPSVQGRVLNSVTGQPIARAIITVVPPSRRELGPEAYRVTTTDSQGRFSLWAVKSGDYIITAERGGFVQGTSSGRALKLSEGQTASGMVFKLTPQGIIRGRVTDADGDVPRKAWVHLWGPVFLGGYRHYEEYAGTRVRDDGTFALGNLEPGHYYISSSLANEAPGVKPAPRQSGPVQIFYPDSTDLSSATAIEIQPGAEINNVTIRFREVPIYRVRGRIDGASGNFEKPQFSIIPETRWTSNDAEAYMTTMRIDPDGSFECTGVKAGDYLVTGQVTLKSASGPQASGLHFIYQSLKVDRDLDAVSVVLRESYNVVNGTLRDEQDKFPDGLVGHNGGVSVVLRSLISGWWNGAVAVNEHGSIHSSDPSRLPIPGAVRAELAGLPEELFVKSVRLAGKDVTYRSFNLTSAGGTFEVVVAPGAARLSGVVHDSKGAPLDGVVITIWSAEKPSGDSLGFPRLPNRIPKACSLSQIFLLARIASPPGKGSK